MSDPASELLASARRSGASDVHVEPEAGGCRVRERRDGLLVEVARTDADGGRMLVGRMMAAAGLLTYKPNLPQEGRLPLPGGGEARLAVMPTVHGLRAVVRLPVRAPGRLDSLGLPPAALAGLESFLRAEAGLLAICGPAGSGKTTVAYALLAQMAAAAPVSAVSVEDPVERHLPGVAQIEVQPFGELTFAKALRSVLRQDPQVILVGEMRDAETAAVAVQAALGGHRVVTTVHAADGPLALVRWREMGVPAYQLASAVHGVLAVRLLRRRGGDGYAGRVPVAEWMGLGPALRASLLAGADAAALRAAAGLAGLRAAAQALVAEGCTDQTEVERVLGTDLP